MSRRLLKRFTTPFEKFLWYLTVCILYHVYLVTLALTSFKAAWRCGFLGGHDSHNCFGWLHTFHLTPALFPGFLSAVGLWPRSCYCNRFRFSRALNLVIVDFYLSSYYKYNKSREIVQSMKMGKEVVTNFRRDNKRPFKRVCHCPFGLLNSFDLWNIEVARVFKESILIKNEVN